MSDAFEKFAPEESAEDYLEREGTPKPYGEVEEGPGGFSEDALATLFTHVSFANHYGNFIKGIVETRNIAFFVLFSLFALFLALRSIESTRSRG